MATPSIILAWKIPWTEEPVDYSPRGHKESDMTEQLCIHRCVITFLPKSKRLLISWLQSRPAVILENKKIKSDTVSIFPPSICPEVMGREAIVLDFWLMSFKPAFSLSSFTFISSVQFRSATQSCPTLCNPMNHSSQASLSTTNSRSSLRPMSIESVMPSSHLILCRPLLLLTPIPPSIRVFSNESTLHMRRPKYWSVSFTISPSNEHPGLISFRMDWLDLLAVQGTLKSLLQHHSSKASIL